MVDIEKIEDKEEDNGTSTASVSINWVTFLKTISDFCLEVSKHVNRLLDYLQIILFVVLDWFQSYKTCEHCEHCEQSEGNRLRLKPSLEIIKLILNTIFTQLDVLFYCREACSWQGQQQGRKADGLVRLGVRETNTGESGLALSFICTFW